MLSAPARREVVSRMKDGGLTERHALRVVAMSASSLRYQSAPDRNIALRSSILALAHRHRRYGAGMIYLKLRQRGLVVNSGITALMLELRVSPGFGHILVWRKVLPISV